MHAHQTQRLLQGLVSAAKAGHLVQSGVQSAQLLGRVGSGAESGVGCWWGGGASRRDSAQRIVANSRDLPNEQWAAKTAAR